MSEFNSTSLHEELEVRVIALLTGELKEAEAEELEQILAINPELSDFRDQMAELMGELHEARGELASSEGEPPRQLSEARRAKIFGDTRVLESKTKPKKIWFRPTFWGLAASIAMLFMIGILSTIQFTQSVIHENQIFEAMPAEPSAQKEPEYTVNLEQRNKKTPPPRPPAITVNRPSELNIPALDIDVNAAESWAYGRGGGGFGGGDLDDGGEGLRELRSNDARKGKETSGSKSYVIDAITDGSIPVEIPAEQIEGTPRRIELPDLEPPATEAPRMLVATDAAAPTELREPRQGSKPQSSLTARLGDDAEKRIAGISGSSRLGVDPFAATRPSRDKAEKEEFKADGYAVSGPVDAFAAPAAKSKPSDLAYAKRKSDVGKLAKDGRRDFLNGDYAVAADAFDEISGIDPGNAEAKLFASRIEELEDLQGQVKSREEMLRQVDQAWERPKVFGLEMDQRAAPDNGYSEKLNNIVIPQVNFSGMPLSKVVETLSELSAVYDTDKKGVPIEYKPVDGQDPKVNISLRNLNLDRILQFVTSQVNYSYDVVDGEFIRVQPKVELSGVEQMAQARAANVRQTPKPEKLAAEEPFSTFSLNISDVSFKLAQAALQNSRVPPAAQIRTEEFVNSFDYGDPSPRPDEPVSMHWEIAQHPFEHDRQVVRFSLQTQASGRQSGQPLNLSLLVDNSGSMQRSDRQAILRSSLQTLEEKLTPQDQLNIVLFARQPRLIAEAGTRASQKAAVETALAYRPEGGTNLEAGLKAAYESARRNFVPSGSNRVILLTDGAANLGNFNAGELAEYVVEQRKQGIALDAYGIGWDDYNDALLEEITRNGDGRYAFLNSVEEASDDFSEKLAGTLRVAAANVKVQIQWNPERVERYRQIGYDLHQLKKEDFRDSTVDAAEIGEAESGTALYVLKIADDPEIIGGLGTLRVRYLDPASGLYRERSWPLPMPHRVPAADSASPSMRLAMSSAFFGERLSASPYAGGYSFHDLYTMTSGLPEAFPNQSRVSRMQSMLLQASEIYGENK